MRPDAKKPSDTWARWSREFAWQERALAHDRHLDGVRRKGVEEARYEVLGEPTALHGGVMEYLQNLDWSDPGVRLQDVTQIVKLKFDATMRFEESAQVRADGAGGRDPDWTLDARGFADS